MIHTQYVTGYEGRQKTIYSRNDSFDIYLIGNEEKENMERITGYYSGILRHNRITNEIDSFTFNPVPHIISLCCFQNILYYIHLTWNDQNVNCSIMKLNFNTIKISSTEVYSFVLSDLYSVHRHIICRQKDRVSPLGMTVYNLNIYRQ